MRVMHFYLKNQAATAYGESHRNSLHYCWRFDWCFGVQVGTRSVGSFRHYLRKAFEELRKMVVDM